MPTVALIDYGSGNLASAAKALARAANGKHDIVTTADPQVVKDAERIVLPGVGAFADCMTGLKAVPGMVDALRETYDFVVLAGEAADDGTVLAAIEEALAPRMRLMGGALFFMLPCCSCRCCSHRCVNTCSCVPHS